MKWICVNDERPIGYPEHYIGTHDVAGEVSVLVYGYDFVNFYPRYEIKHINDVAALKPTSDGRYILDGLIVSHWTKIERP